MWRRTRQWIMKTARFVLMMSAQAPSESTRPRRPGPEDAQTGSESPRSTWLVATGSPKTARHVASGGQDRGAYQTGPVHRPITGPLICLQPVIWRDAELNPKHQQSRDHNSCFHIKKQPGEDQLTAL
ncbi:hypothetical protein J6590_042124 [Homalodisca vitripennis]|nr:hypothetical protein J6590_042124 [Homalodisca vitripennis]